MKTTVLLIIGAMLLMTACNNWRTGVNYPLPQELQHPNNSTGNSTPSAQDNPPTTGLANPASVYCEKQGGTIKMVDEGNGTRGDCILGDGTVCDEWSYYRNECPTKQQNPPENVACTMDAKACPDGSFVGRVGPHCEWAPCPGPRQP